MRFLESIADAVLGRTPEELIGAVLLGVAISAVLAGIYSLGQKKSPPSTSFVGNLAFGGVASGMLLAAGYIQYRETAWIVGEGPVSQNGSGPARGPQGQRPPHQPPNEGFPRGIWSSGFHVVVAADTDRDGRVTADELARMVHEADTDGDGSVNFHDIDRLMASRFRPSWTLPKGLPEAGTEDHPGGEGPPAPPDSPQRTRPEESPSS